MVDSLRNWALAGISSIGVCFVNIGGLCGGCIWNWVVDSLRNWVLAGISSIGVCFVNIGGLCGGCIPILGAVLGQVVGGEGVIGWLSCIVDWCWDSISRIV